MWKIMIVDDEPKIRRGIRSLVEREVSDCEVVAEAEDGEMALELVSRHEPDILLVDVRMPFKDGLEFAEELSRRPGERAVIMISGHDEFEYARRALKAQVSDYLLKPVEPAVLVAAIEKAKSTLLSRRDESSWLSWARAELDRNLPSIRDRFFHSLLAGSLSKTELEESASFLSLNLPPSAILFGGRLPEGIATPALGGELQRRLQVAALSSLCREALEEFSPLFLVEDETEIVVALLPEAPEERLVALRDRLERESRAAIQVKANLAWRRVGLDGLCEAWDELQGALAVSENAEVFVTLARNYVERHYANPDLSLEDTAQAIQISPGYLSRLMKRETGFSFVDYLSRCRIKKATELMVDPSAKVFEVADAVGYRSQHYFARAFKKVLGISPSDYRKGKAP